ncbi:hypothetical protein GCM10010389_28840 [Streptomyces echinoruber]|uniref:Uncharacterized protein n=1 Tax=Streptomyces echinoruber TaxID=68898 RepID=A0A918R6S8_9ACTN|nr:hypothetical protein GCM10010389_28840 [Streptomyces echinoruber]
MRRGAEASRITRLRISSPPPAPPRTGNPTARVPHGEGNEHRSPVDDVRQSRKQGEEGERGGDSRQERGTPAWRFLASQARSDPGRCRSIMDDPLRDVVTLGGTD